METPKRVLRSNLSRGGGRPINPFVKKLCGGANLSAEDQAKLTQVCSRRREVGARVQIIDEGESPSDVHLVLQGYACRTKTLPDGQRQIMALLLPGDFCDLHVAILGEMDHAILTLTPCTVVDIPRATIEELTTGSRDILQALWWATLVDEAILREWLVNIGRRQAEQRLAHLFCELFVRLRLVGLTKGSTYELPFTQEELGDLLGLSVVHVNRVLQKLRTARLVDWRGGLMEIPDMERLIDLSGFNPNYLHLRGPASAPADLADGRGRTR